LSFELNHLPQKPKFIMKTHFLKFEKQVKEVVELGICKDRGANLVGISRKINPTEIWISKIIK